MALLSALYGATAIADAPSQLRPEGPCFLPVPRILIVSFLAGTTLAWAPRHDQQDGREAFHAFLVFAGHTTGCMDKPGHAHQRQLITVFRAIAHH